MLGLVAAVALAAGGCGSGSDDKTAQWNKDMNRVEASRVYTKAWNRLAQQWIDATNRSNVTAAQLQAFEPKLAAQVKGLASETIKLNDPGLRTRELAIVENYRTKLQAISRINLGVAEGKPSEVKRGYAELHTAGTQALKIANDFLTYTQKRES